MAEWKAPTQDRVDGYFKELNNWGRWGNDDQKGTVNLITAAKRQSALGLVKTGRTVSLARDVVPMPVFMYHATFPSERERADVVLDPRESSPYVAWAELAGAALPSSPLLDDPLLRFWFRFVFPHQLSQQSDRRHAVVEQLVVKFLG